MILDIADRNFAQAARGIDFVVDKANRELDEVWIRIKYPNWVNAEVGQFCWIEPEIISQYRRSDPFWRPKSIKTSRQLDGGAYSLWIEDKCFGRTLGNKVFYRKI